MARIIAELFSQKRETLWIADIEALAFDPDGRLFLCADARIGHSLRQKRVPGKILLKLTTEEKLHIYTTDVRALNLSQQALPDDIPALSLYCHEQRTVYSRLTAETRYTMVDWIVPKNREEWWMPTDGLVVVRKKGYVRIDQDPFFHFEAQNKPARLYARVRRADKAELVMPVANFDLPYPYRERDDACLQVIVPGMDDWLLLNYPIDMTR